MAFAELGKRVRGLEPLAMINPVKPAFSVEAVAIYRVEPYAAADAHAPSPHVGSEAGAKVTSVLLDGVEQGDRMIPLVDDQRDHVVTVMLQAG